MICYAYRTTFAMFLGASEKLELPDTLKHDIYCGIIYNPFADQMANSLHPLSVCLLKNSEVSVTSQPILQVNIETHYNYALPFPCSQVHSLLFGQPSLHSLDYNPLFICSCITKWGKKLVRKAAHFLLHYHVLLKK